MSARSAELRPAALQLLAASFTVLFQELAIIRWLPSQVRVVAYFPNLILLSAFLGLGIGCLRARRRALAWLWPASLLLLAGAAAALGRVAWSENSASEHLWLLYYDLPRGAPLVQGVRLPILACFALSALTFVPLGQIVAERLNVFRAREAPLWGYSWDIVGSLCGVVAFTALSFFGAGPAAWFSVVAVAGAVFFRESARRLALYAAASAGLVAVIAAADKAEVYSPYYALSTHSEPGPGRGFGVLTNGSLHQFAFSVVDTDPLSFPGEAIARAGYRLPYELLGRPPGRVLVVGAGTGNDVATLLAMGAEHVDAVEIDPEILRLGRERHPNRPYASPRVRLVNADARSYLNATRESYDLIVFGTLDSMTRLSALSNVRLDNFMYTRECLEAARRRLTPRGGLVLYFMVPASYIDARLHALLVETFDQAPYSIVDHYRLFNRALMAGPAFDHMQGEARREAAANVRRSLLARVEVPSDDWPYLYLSSRGISGFYLGMIAAILTLSVLAVALVSPHVRSGLRTGRAVDWEMLLFGLAFLLLETKAVTDMSLLWGATWLTNSVVFGAILLTILAATLCVQHRLLPWPVATVGLVAALVAVYAVPVRLLLSMGVAERLGFSLVYVGAPIFFAASTFALLFETRERADEAFGWNVIGAVAGGLIEFSSMAVGLRALALLALLAYLLAMLVRLRRTAAVASATTG